jgi:hypothetical protein
VIAAVPSGWVGDDILLASYLLVHATATQRLVPTPKDIVLVAYTPGATYLLTKEEEGSRVAAMLSTCFGRPKDME